jgi:hypothetical protein
MPGTRKPRKRYRPADRRMDHDPISLAASQAALLSIPEQTATLAKARSGFDALRAGNGSVSAWQSVADGLNLAEMLVKLRIGSNLGPDIRAGQLAMAALMHQVKAGGGWTMRGPQLATIDNALDLYRVQLSLCSRGELREAHAMVRSRIRAALAGHRESGVTVHDPATPPAAAAR